MMSLDDCLYFVSEDEIWLRTPLDLESDVTIDLATGEIGHEGYGLFREVLRYFNWVDEQYNGVVNADVNIEAISGELGNFESSSAYLLFTATREYLD